MITYAVTAEVREDLRARYELYMRDRHIPDMLATGLFLGASFLRAEDGRYQARYDFADRESYDRYIATHATRLRTDFSAHFAEGVAVDRNVWTVLAEWPD
jgi:hypothetical protein